MVWCITPTRRSHADSMVSGECISGSTVLRWAAMSAASGGATVTNTPPRGEGDGDDVDLDDVAVDDGVDDGRDDGSDDATIGRTHSLALSSATARDANAERLAPDVAVRSGLRKRLGHNRPGALRD